MQQEDKIFGVHKGDTLVSYFILKTHIGTNSLLNTILIKTTTKMLKLKRGKNTSTKKNGEYFIYIFFFFFLHIGGNIQYNKLNLSPGLRNTPLQNKNLLHIKVLLQFQIAWNTLIVYTFINNNKKARDIKCLIKNTMPEISISSHWFGMFV